MRSDAVALSSQLPDLLSNRSRTLSHISLEPATSPAEHISDSMGTDLLGLRLSYPFASDCTIEGWHGTYFSTMGDTCWVASSKVFSLPE